MTTSRIGSGRGIRALLAALTLAGGLGAATVAEAAPAFAPLASPSAAEVLPVQYWGDHGGGGHRRHEHHHGHRHSGYGHGGYGHDGYGRGRDHGWGHRDHGWGHRHHGHHRGHSRFDY